MTKNPKKISTKQRTSLLNIATQITALSYEDMIDLGDEISTFARAHGDGPFDDADMAAETLFKWAKHYLEG